MPLSLLLPTAIFPDPPKNIPRRIGLSEEGEHATKPALIPTMLGVGTRKQSEEPNGGRDKGDTEAAATMRFAIKYLQSCFLLRRTLFNEQRYGH